MIHFYFILASILQFKQLGVADETSLEKFLYVGSAYSGSESENDPRQFVDEDEGSESNDGLEVTKEIFCFCDIT